MKANQRNKKKERPIAEIIAALPNGIQALRKEDLYSFSYLNDDNLSNLKTIWPGVSSETKNSLYEGLYLLYNEDMLVDFSMMGSFGVNDADPIVRRYSLGLMVECRRSSFLKKVLEIACNDPDTDVRQSAIEILGQFVIDMETKSIPVKEKKRILTVLEALIQDPDEKIRLHAMESLAYMDHPLVADLIKSALLSTKEENVIAGLRAVQHSLNRKWADRIVDLIDHPDPDIQAEAIKAAGLIQSRKTIKPILNLLTNFDELDNDVLDAAILAISLIGGPHVREIIEELEEVFADETDMADLFDEAKDNLDLNDFIQKKSEDPEFKAFMEPKDIETDSEENDELSEEDYLQLIRQHIENLPLPTDSEEEEDFAPKIHLHDENDHDLDWSRFRIIEDLSKESEQIDEEEDWEDDESDEESQDF
ncbi:MAG: HEAT repeat domain-containing protein [Flexilinea flocculi]|nr:HEAT repeat domain-containing protein [Flexilinea flocculi]